MASKETRQGIPLHRRMQLSTGRVYVSEVGGWICERNHGGTEHDKQRPTHLATREVTGRICEAGDVCEAESATSDMTRSNITKLSKWLLVRSKT